MFCLKLKEHSRAVEKCHNSDNTFAKYIEVFILLQQEYQNKNSRKHGHS